MDCSGVMPTTLHPGASVKLPHVSKGRTPHPFVGHPSPLSMCSLALGAPLLLPSMLDKAPRQGGIQEFTAVRRLDLDDVCMCWTHLSCDHFADAAMQFLICSVHEKQMETRVFSSFFGSETCCKTNNSNLCDCFHKMFVS